MTASVPPQLVPSPGILATTDGSQTGFSSSPVIRRLEQLQWEGFIPGRTTADFYRWWLKAFFQGDKKRLKFSFTKSKLRKKYFQISHFAESSPRPLGTPL